MVKILKNKKNKSFLYFCENGDTLDSIAQHFNVRKIDILNNNPLFSEVYTGCALWISGVGSKIHIVQPLQSLDEIAKLYNCSKNQIILDNGLNNEQIFLGQQLKISLEDKDV